MTEDTTTKSTESDDNSDSAGVPHVFALRPGGRYHLAEGPNFGHGVGDEAYRFVQDDEIAATLREAERAGESAFRYIRSRRLAEALDTADRAITAIETGEFDDVLDLVLFAERNEFANRVTVIDAIADRKTKVEQQRQTQPGDTGGLSLDEVAPKSGLE
ncbi:hypothetical protein [Haloplanus halophilus]|uniref:hypothetical protein n=1 Tax=Haloplanus halophilus TaxID=2949993 RepID=UPI002040BBC9|nr:hypothetical protein [Haloplanus sp. GDY1]